MIPRSLLAPCLVLMICMPARAGTAGVDPPKRFLSPAEVAQIVEQSEVLYKTTVGMEGLPDVNSANTADRLFPLSAREITCPWRVQKDNGSVEVVEFPFPPEAASLFEEAESHFRSRRYPLAVSSYQNIIYRFPDCYLAYAHLGDTYYQMRQYRTALENLEVAIRLNPWDHRTFVYKADALMHLGRPEEAKAAFIHALSLRPRYWLALANLRHLADTLGVQVRTDLFQPRAFVRREKDDIAVYVDGKDALAVWLSYALVKAIWLGEPAHRQEMLGTSTYRWSSLEEMEALLNLVTIYRRAKQDGTVRADPKLDLLEQIVETRDLHSFVCYEIASRMSPHIMLTLSEEARQSVREFIAKYVVVSVPGRPLDERNQRVAPITMTMDTRMISGQGFPDSVGRSLLRASHKPATVPLLRFTCPGSDCHRLSQLLDRKVACCPGLERAREILHALVAAALQDGGSNDRS